MKQKLTKGDIIVFKAEDDWLSKAIAWFTKSDACHAAMAYSEDSIVEVGAPGIGVHKVEVSDGDDIYVMRLISEPDPAPLIASADAYLNAKVRYDFPKLFILAGLILYRRIKPTTEVLQVSDEILTVCCFMLDEMIQHVLLHHDDQAMVCSELVYHIFYACGKEYEIQITNGEIWNNIPESDSGRASDDYIRLYDYLPAEKNTTASLDINRPESAPVSPERTESLAKKLYTALCQSEMPLPQDNGLSEQTSSPKFSGTVLAADKFLTNLQHFMELVKCDLPIEAMFITPGDFVYNADNLKNMGNIHLQRI